MVAIAQLVERPPVARKVTGSYPVSYPKQKRSDERFLVYIIFSPLITLIKLNKN